LESVEIIFRTRTDKYGAVAAVSYIASDVASKTKKIIDWE